MSNDNVNIRNTGFFASLWPFTGDESRKVRYLATANALLIFSYSMFKPLKDTIFLSFVGPVHQPEAKLMMVVMLPIITALYSFIVSRSKRYYAAMFFTMFYAAICVLFAGIFLHPAIGIANTATSVWRFTGWIYYGLFDVFSLTVMTTFWAVTSSVSTPENASAQYGIMATVSRIAGMTASGTVYLLLKSSLSAVVTIPVSLMFCCAALTATAYCLRRMFKTVEYKALEGYTDQHEQPGAIHPKLTMWEGLKAIISQPYAFGIFGLICGYELIATLIDFRVQCLVATQTAFNIKGIGSYISGYTFWFQAIGSLIALFGTTRLPKLFGMRIGLLITPTMLLCIALVLFTNANLWTLTSLMIAMRALNYSFNIPVREMLFIPASKTIQFLAKGWIESFGKTFSKVSGAMYNWLTVYQSATFIMPVTAAATVTISAAWMGIAFLMGGAYQRAIAEDRIIGAETEK